MKRYPRYLSILGLVFISEPVSAQSVCPHEAELLDATLTGHVEAVRRGDLDSILADFDPQARLVGPGQSFEGAAIRKHYEDALGNYRLEPAPVIERREFFGDWAIAEGPYLDRAISRDSGEETQTSGAYVLLYRCDRSAAAWRIFRILWQ